MFERLVGNNRIKELLITLRSKGRVPNSVIFAGPGGVGKKQFAIELAKSLLCPSPRSNQACDECSSCRRADVFVFPKADDKDDHRKVIFSEHPDLGMVVPYNRNVLVDAVRALETEAQFRPYEAASRVFLVDDADKMNDAASNALLKTLEEPAAASHIFLITSRPDSLLTTIRSRCQILRFGPVSTTEIEKFLTRTNKFLPEDVPLAARMADGSIGAAMRTDIEKLRNIRQLMLEVLENGIERNDRAELLRIAESMNDAKHKADFEDHIAVLKVLAHDTLLLKAGTSAGEIVNVDIADRLEALAGLASLSELGAFMELIEQLQGNLIVNVNRRVATDALFLSVAG